MPADQPASLPYTLSRPENWRGGLIVSSPHSGRAYPDWFLRRTRLDAHALRASEDAFVDHLVEPALGAGAVVLTALVPRAVVDLNRARDDLDPAVIADVDTNPSARSRAGLGVIPRIVARDQPIRDALLPRAEAEIWLSHLWQPYHDMLDRLIAEAVAKFGQAVLIDMHSMPHSAIARQVGRPQMVLGNLWGRAASDRISKGVGDIITRAGFRLGWNTPFAGAYILDRHGNPDTGRHAIQIEIDRSLYMNEDLIRPHDNFTPLVSLFGGMWGQIAGLCAQIASETDP